MRLIPLFIALSATASLSAIDQEFPIVTHTAPYPTFGSVEKLEPELDNLIAPQTEMQALAVGFDWSEGAAWDAESESVFFSDIPRNAVYRWNENDGVSIFLLPSGFTGDFYDGREPGSNGLTFDRENRLVLAQHGNRQIARLNKDRWGFTPLASEFEGKRFNSPNDLCFDSKGNLFFTDPPYGLAKSATQELDFQGVYRLSADGQLTLLTKEMERPNGIALAPDEKTLYVANSHGPRPIIMAYPVLDDGSLGEGHVFWDSTELRAAGRRGGNDGLKTDTQGNVWATGPGGVLILSPEGKHLGSLLTGRFTANCAFGGEDRSILYITADDTLCRIQTKVQGYSPNHP